MVIWDSRAFMLRPPAPPHQGRLVAAQRKRGLAHAHGQRVGAGKAGGDDAHGLAGQKADFHESQQQFLLLVRAGQQIHHPGRHLARSWSRVMVAAAPEGNAAGGHEARAATEPQRPSRGSKNHGALFIDFDSHFPF
jgi:hypothetical protein